MSVETNSMQLIFKGNPFDICNDNLIKKIKDEIRDKLIHNRSYSVISNVKEGTFQNFMNFLNNNQSLDIQKENFLEYVMLNNEFGCLDRLINQKLDEFGIDFKYISILISKQNQDCSIYEEIISKNLYNYLDNYKNQMKHIPINSLYNIFSNKYRKLDEQGEEKAYQFIKEISNDSKDNLILLQLLDGRKLDKKSQLEIISLYRENCGYNPKIDFVFELIKSQLDEINLYKKENEKLNDKIKNLEINISQINAKNDEQQKKINDLELKKMELIDEIKQINYFLNQKPDQFIKSFEELHQNEYCHFSYLLDKEGNGDKYGSEPLMIKANEVTKLSFIYMIPGNDINSICTLKKKDDTSEVTFKKDGSYLLFLNLQIKGTTEEKKTANIKISTPYNFVHYLNYDHTLDVNNSTTSTILCFWIISANTNDSFYLNVKPSIDINIFRGTTVNTYLSIVRIGEKFGQGKSDSIFNVLTNENRVPDNS